MCDGAVAGRGVASVRPRWGVLYLTLAGATTAALATDLAGLARPWPATAHAAFAALAVATLWLWIRHEAVRLDQTDWCACAPATVTMRVIPSRPGPPSGDLVEDRFAVRAVADGETSTELEHAGVE
jgi:hypothetical protein